MDFMQSQTKENLARSFAGESQARNRYTVYAEVARKEKQEYIARIFDESAKNEEIHAKEFLEMIVKLAGKPLDNIDYDAGYPYQLGNTAENLQFAIDGEDAEFAEVYPAFAKKAREEGFADAAALWENIAPIEGLHRNIFTETLQQLSSGALSKKDSPVVWRCINCGYVIEANAPWKVCPVCHKDSSWAEGDIDKKNMPHS